MHMRIGGIHETAVVHAAETQLANFSRADLDTSTFRRLFSNRVAQEVASATEPEATVVEYDLSRFHPKDFNAALSSWQGALDRIDFGMYPSMENFATSARDASQRFFRAFDTMNSWPRSGLDRVDPDSVFRTVHEDATAMQAALRDAYAAARELEPVAQRFSAARAALDPNDIGFAVANLRTRELEAAVEKDPTLASEIGSVIDKIKAYTATPSPA